MSTPTRRVTFTAQPLVWIAIRGERVSEDKYRARKDGGLISRFLQWSEREKIWPAGVGGQSGAGSFMGAFQVDDAERVVAWLRAEGVIEEPSP